MANAENINRVIASIKGEIEATKEIGFNMGDYVTKDAYDLSGRSCGTVACIAGHAYSIVKNGVVDTEVAWREAEDVGAEFLDLGMSDADALFYGYGASCPLDAITPQKAIRTLEHLRDTGEVDWTV